jgi:hypothetical protein
MSQAGSDISETVEGMLTVLPNADGRAELLKRALRLFESFMSIIILHNQDVLF